MNEWGEATYGDPCRECGFSWSTPTADAVAMVEVAPTLVAGALGDAHGDERHPDLGWTVTGYVLHIADNLAIWAERLAGIALGDATTVGSYDENELARARGYEQIGMAAAQWSLQRASDAWLDAFRLTSVDLVMVHPNAAPSDSRASPKATPTTPCTTSGTSNGR